MVIYIYQILGHAQRLILQYAAVGIGEGEWVSGKSNQSVARQIVGEGSTQILRAESNWERTAGYCGLTDLFPQRRTSATGG